MTVKYSLMHEGAVWGVRFRVLELIVRGVVWEVGAQAADARHPWIGGAL